MATNDTATAEGASNVLLNQRPLTAPYARKTVGIQGDEHLWGAIGFDGTGTLGGISVTDMISANLTEVQNLLGISGGPGASTDAEYLVNALSGSLTAERVLTAGTGITLTPGAGSLTIAVPGYTYGASSQIGIASGGTNQDITIDPSGTGGVLFPNTNGSLTVALRVPFQAAGGGQPAAADNLILGNGGTLISRTGTNPVNPVSSGGQNNGIQNTYFGVNAGLANTTGNLNTFIGDSTGRACVNGDQNVFVGAEAGRAVTNGYMNVYIGSNAGLVSTTGYLNTVIGCDAGIHVTGNQNVIIGAGAGAEVTSSNNVIIGKGTCPSLTSGGDIVAIGVGACGSMTTASDTVAIGPGALQFCIVGFNSAFGSYALNACTTGSYNVACGRQSLMLNTTGASNTALGHGALKANTTASENTAAGEGCLTANTTGIQNTAVGSQALRSNVAGTDNVAVGKSALESTIGSNNAAVGSSAMKTNDSGAFNSVLGSYALFANTSGTFNVAVGYETLRAATLVHSSVAVGAHALKLTTTGTQNTAVGSEALYTNVTGARNVALGLRAGYYETGSDAFYVDNQDRLDTAGDKAGALLYGKFNVAPANQTLQVNAGSLLVHSAATWAGSIGFDSERGWNGSNGGLGILLFNGRNSALAVKPYASITGRIEVSTPPGSEVGELRFNTYVAGVDTTMIDMLANRISIGNGTAVPDASALLSLTSTNAGFLLPRMTKAQRNAIATPTDGLIIYQTDATPGLRMRQGGAWVSYTTAADA